ncbi:MAG: TAT-variant-translocated molybdopterin oxidoreductase [Acidobacteriia bacterium]|nr:TAT-variant-translocated molybdopterin oxidoreductase [Terriglobia bacterium]
MRADDHKNEHTAGQAPEHEHDAHGPHAEELTPREYALDLAAIRERLGKTTGKEYWRSLEELSDNPHFTELLHREFPRQASEWDDSVDRRDFLKLMAASLALAGLSGCGRAPEETVVPYIKQPEGLILGKPRYYATAMPLGADAIGLLVESHEGRPTKIEGNPDHPASLGATNAFAQASVLGLYDPDRSQVLTYLGEIRSWSGFLAEVAVTAAGLKTTAGAGLRILTGSVISPTLGAQLRGLLAQFPQASWHQWEPAGSDGAREGGKLAFGRYVNTVYRPEKAAVILALDSDFLGSGAGHVRYSKEFFRRRKVGGPQTEMNRLYVIEPTPSVTGASADHRVPMRASDVALFARALAAKLGLGGGVTLPAGSERLLEAVAADLQQHRGAGLVVAGDYQPAEVHALAHAINQALGNTGATLYYTDPVESQPASQLESLRALCADLDAGRVDTLLILGGNPVYNAPHDLDFTAKLKKARLAVHLSAYFDETSDYCHWHIPEAHYLESWSDVRAFDGTASIVQPLIAPLYQGKTAHDVVGAFSDKPGLSSYERVRATWLPGNTEKEWRKWLHDGVIAGSALPALALSTKWSPAGLPAAKPAPADALEFLFRPDAGVYDGRFANNGWLQELPRPVTKLTWDNAALLSPATAEKLGVGHRAAFTGGEHGQIRSDLLDVTLSGSKVTAAAWTLPGQADGVVTLPLGYGRKKAGSTGSNKGFNAYVVRASSALWSATGGSLRKTGQDYPLACTQYHHNMEGRELVRSASLEEFKSNPAFAHEGAEEPPKSLSLYKEFAYPGYAWGMAIDLASCNGCNACVVACVSENNIPVVGKDQVMAGREMHWIRIDRYYEGAVDAPETFFQPVPCQQCENAPCEQVCPVGATVHSAEGLNDMVYNRCIGTRYCSNNCPYKVRRFNFLRFQDWDTPSLKLLRNPEVTVRSRGVMEKCTYCVQRINNVRMDAEKQNRPIRDGEVVTACEAACPAEAIVFGNANDPNSRVAKLKAQQRNYAILAELNARPRTTYLAAVRNPNPAIEKAGGNSGKMDKR